MADQLWSLAVRDDWNWECAVCEAGKVEAHHLIPRQNGFFRYDLNNGIALCAQHHQFCPDLSPHQNAAGWLQWLMEHHTERWQWYMENVRAQHTVTRNVQYYLEAIRDLQQYVPDDEFQRIVGKRFAAYLSEVMNA